MQVSNMEKYVWQGERLHRKSCTREISYHIELESNPLIRSFTDPEPVLTRKNVSYDLFITETNRLVYVTVDKRIKDSGGFVTKAIINTELPHVIDVTKLVDRFSGNFSYSKTFDNVLKWCCENCSGIWMPYASTEILFSEGSDAVAVKMRFYNGQFIG